ncbi:AEC family transporter [Virgibacillus sp. JSM 102003]|uniref:AEC family transporter n=1 Tax=Virgibacillus sp. JSM 102003 TaxID=1562108 RepID=UPI0035C0D018
MPGFNIGLFAYPLVEGIWGREGIKYFGMFDVGNAFIVFGLLYLIGSYYSSDKAELSLGVIMRKLTGSIPLMTYITVCGLNIISVQLPEMVINVSEIVSVANMPLSFLLLGIYLNFKFDKRYYTLIMKVLTIRYVLGLTVGISLFYILPYDDMFKYTVLIGLMLPVSVSVLPYSVEFNYDQRFIGTVSNLTILITFFLLWILMNIIS